MSLHRTTAEMEAKGVWIEDMEAEWDNLIGLARAALATLTAEGGEE